MVQLKHHFDALADSKYAVTLKLSKVARQNEMKQDKLKAIMERKAHKEREKLRNKLSCAERLVEKLEKDNDSLRIQRTSLFAIINDVHRAKANDNM